MPTDDSSYITTEVEQLMAEEARWTSGLGSFDFDDLSIICTGSLPPLEGIFFISNIKNIFTNGQRHNNTDHFKAF